MPITETPPSSEQRRPEPEIEGKRSKYDRFEMHELLQQIDELEDDRRWARLREGIWISIIAHMILFSLISWGPRYLLHMPRVVNPADILKNRKDLTYLDLPPDALKQIKPKRSDVISDKDRVAQSKKPTIDKKTLQELQAMKKAGPPAPQPAPQQQQAPPSPQPQQQAQQQPQQQHPTQPLQPNQQSQLEAPRASPVPARPNFNTGPLSAGDAIRQAARSAAQQGPGGGEYGANAPNAHPGIKMGGPEILSDTMGVDFGPYLNHIVRETRQTWEPLIPESARPPLMKNGTVAIEFMIGPDGRVLPNQMRLVGPSGDTSLDRAAWGAITGSNYPPLPKEFKGPYLALRFYFLYNPKPGQDY